MIRGIHHVALHTPNFDKMLKFYKDAFGFEPAAPDLRWKDSAEVDAIIGLKGSAARTQMLKAGNCYIELFEYSLPADGRKGPPLRPHDHGYTHFCVDVTDVDDEVKRLAKAGMTFPREPVTVGNIRTIYGKDPDGNIIEIQQVAASDAFSMESLTGAAPKTTRG